MRENAGWGRGGHGRTGEGKGRRGRDGKREGAGRSSRVLRDADLARMRSVLSK